MRTRVIQFFKDEQLYLQFDFGTFALMLFCSSKIDPSKAQLFLKLCVSEYTYGSTYNLPIVNEEASQVNHISFDYNALRSTIFFLKDVVMNALLNEDTDNLVKKFGGLEKLEFSINSGQEQVTNFIGVNNEFYHEEPGTLWGSFKALKEFFEMILAENIPFKTYIG